jgi:hypothetical protein
MEIEDLKPGFCLDVLSKYAIGYLKIGFGDSFPSRINCLSEETQAERAVTFDIIEHGIYFRRDKPDLILWAVDQIQSHPELYELV